MRGTKGLVSGARPKTTTRGAGKVNGLVNGRGRVNGLVNGLGRTNGLVNGVGRVNGLVTPTGRVNGLMGEQGRINGTITRARSARAGRKEIRLSVPTKRVRYAAIAAATLFAVLIAVFLFIPIPGPTPPIVIDGSFSDWATVPGVEAQVSTYDLTGFDPAKFRIAVFADDYAGVSSRSLAPLTPNGSVLLELLPVASIVSSTTTPLFTIRAHALGLPAGVSWGVSSFAYNATPGITVFLSTGSVVLTQGQPQATITASALATGVLPGDAVQVDVTNATAPVPVVVRGGPIRAYMVAPPSTVRIDGLFADWVGRDQIDSDSVPVKNPDVDILRYDAAVNASTAYFHVAVAGDLMAGRVPDRFIRLPPGQGGNGSGGPPIPLPRRTGEDILRAYIDLNSTDNVGLPFAGIYADYMPEIRGVAGRITARTLYAWTGSWSPVAAPSVALGRTDIEIKGPATIGR